MSGVGKGIVTASVGKILQARGYRVTAIKVDPYLNVDAGTMNPYQHGEVFVTYDGGETDLDLGHYERFLDIELSRINNITSGQVYREVIMGEREGRYLGQTVQLIPHVTDEIKRRIRLAAEGFDIALVEIGGTVGDYEGLPFLEAARQMRLEEGIGNTLFIHVALVPTLRSTGEFKTKPLQHSVAELRRVGIQPDIIVARAEGPLDQATKAKISLFTNVPMDAIFTSYDVDTIYRVPLILEQQGLGDYVTKALSLVVTKPDLTEWRGFVDSLANPKEEVKVALCGKYVKLKDSYISIIEAIRHAAAHLHVGPRLIWCDSEALEKEPSRVYELNDAHAIVVLPGFGSRGVEGKVEAIKFARESKVPFLGICYGMQLAVVEFARNVVGLSGAHTTEVNPETPHPVIDIAPEQRGISGLGGTMILGDREVRIVEGTLAHEVYGSLRTRERHRHRYEVNPRYFHVLTEHGLVFSGWRVDVPRVEIIELPNHPFYMATQFHLEFRSRPLRPHPIFTALLKAALAKKHNEPPPFKATSLVKGPLGPTTQ